MMGKILGAVMRRLNEELSQFQQILSGLVIIVIIEPSVVKRAFPLTAVKLGVEIDSGLQTRFFLPSVTSLPLLRILL